MGCTIKVAGFVLYIMVMYDWLLYEREAQAGLSFEAEDAVKWQGVD